MISQNKRPLLIQNIITSSSTSQISITFFAKSDKKIPKYTGCDHFLLIKISTIAYN